MDITVLLKCKGKLGTSCCESVDEKKQQKQATFEIAV